MFFGIGEISAVFVVLFALVWIVGFGAFVVGIAAIVSIASLPVEAFGPWWDNTRQAWVLGVAISFLLPFGPLITGIMWFTHGKRALRDGAPQAGRPFWSGAPKPAPPWGSGPPPTSGWQPPQQ